MSNTQPLSPQGYNIDEQPYNQNPFWGTEGSGGQAATVQVGTVTVQTGAAGSNAAVSIQNVGTDTDAILNFNFIIPKGLVGDTGAAGAPGTPGRNGTDGIDGVGIASIVQTQQSTASHGLNVLTITQTDGTVESFSLYNGTDGASGAAGRDGADGVTPNITVNATVNNTIGTPSVVISKSGTNANPIFNFAFSGLKGERGDQGVQGEPGVPGENGQNGQNGQDGQDGVTPSITATATVDTTGQTPSCTVTKTGTDAEPVFEFAFNIPSSGGGGGGSLPVYGLYAEEVQTASTLDVAGTNNAQLNFTNSIDNGDLLSVTLQSTDYTDFYRTIIPVYYCDRYGTPSPMSLTHETTLCVGVDQNKPIVIDFRLSIDNANTVTVIVSDIIGGQTGTYNVGVGLYKEAHS